uniref:DUF834 domain-containing protein n=1 Tax=Oryza meridionalis TaxID=40149 RepID=A0A0E0BYW0_9ORYZ
MRRKSPSALMMQMNDTAGKGGRIGDHDHGSAAAVAAGGAVPGVGELCLPGVAAADEAERRGVGGGGVGVACSTEQWHGEAAARSAKGTTRPISPSMAGSTEAAAALSLPGGVDDDEAERRIPARSRR